MTKKKRKTKYEAQIKNKNYRLTGKYRIKKGGRGGGKKQKKE